MLDSFKVESYLENRQIEYSTEGKNVSEGWVGLSCPFCFDLDPSNHLGVNLESKVIACYRCGIRGTIFKLIMKLEGCSFSQAKLIAEEFSEGKVVLQNRTEEKTLQKKKIDLSFFKNEIPGPHRNYLLGRNFDPDFLFKKYRLLSCWVAGRFKHRIIVPFFLKNRIVTFTSRDITGKGSPKYLSCKDEDAVVPIKNTLYNIDSVKDTAIIVEGVTDVWRIGDGCVAIMGKNYSSKQLEILGNISRLFVMLDSDAVKSSYHLVHDLSNINPNIEIIELDKGDPCDLSNREVEHLRKEVFGKVY